MATTGPEAVVLTAIGLVERRDVDALGRLYHPDVQFWWPPGLPYSGWHYGQGIAAMSDTFARVWLPLQPTDQERRMDPVVVVAVDSGHVVIEYHWRAVAPSGERFETNVLAAYHVVDGLIDQAQMFYGDHDGLCRFLTTLGVIPGADRPAPPA